MKTNAVTHVGFVESGRARAYIYDEDHVGWMYLGLVEDIALTTTKDVRKFQHNVRGSMTDIASKIVGQEAMLRMTLREDANPVVSQLIWGDSATSQTATNTYDVIAGVETPYLYGTNAHYLMHQYGLLQASNAGTPTLGNPTSPATVSAETQQLLANTAYECWVAPGYGTQPLGDGVALTASEFNGTNDTLDKTWTFGTPVLLAAGVTSGAGDAVDAAVFTVDVTAFTITKGPALPDFWVVLVDADAGTLATANVATTFAATALTQTLSVGTQGAVEYATNTPKYFFVQQTLTYGDTPTYTARTATTDVTLNLNNGELKRASGGSFTDGGQCHVTYWHFESPKVVSDVGARGTPEDNRRIRLVCLAEDDPALDDDDMREKGLLYDITYCNCAAINGSQNFTAEDWHTGESVDIPVILDTSNSRFGTQTIYDPLLDAHTVGYK